MPTTGRMGRLASQLSPKPVAAVASSNLGLADWDPLVAAEGVVEFPGNISVEPTTPLIGADIHGLDLTRPLTPGELDTLTSAFHRYKVVMIRSGGKWKMDMDQHTKFCQQVSEHWGLRPDTDQKRLNHSSGMSVHPFLPWHRGYPHIWPTGAVTQGGKQYLIRGIEDNENFEPYLGQKAARRLAKEKSAAGVGEKKEESKDQKSNEAYGAAVPGAEKDSVMNGANGFHFDDGFFHHPPSAVVLNAIVLPKVGGDTIFANMGAAYHGLPAALQERAKQLTQTMGWEHTIHGNVWINEAKRREADGDSSFWDRIEKFKRDYPPSLQPLIRMHPVTGELSIYTNRGFTHHINDVSAEENRNLMDTLCRMAERPEYQVRMRWRNEGDVCIYDNRITQHYAVADYGNVGPRSLHHIALLGDPTKNAFGEVVG